METFYEKIFIFFLNFKNAQKGVKHFKDLITILEITIVKFKMWKSTMSKLYLLTLLHEIIASIKQYLLHFDTRGVVIDDTDYPNLNDDFLDLIEEESYRATGEKTLVDRESNILNYPTPTLNKLNSVIPHTHEVESQSDEIQNKILWRDLPENLVKIFEIIVNLSVEDEPIVRKIHNILFEIFKAVIWELNLFSIIKMNKLLVSKCKILMTYDKKIPQKSVKLMIITLDCFHEFVVILNKKLDQSRTRDDSDANQLIITDKGGEVIEINEVLRMFEGIVDFILKGLFGHSKRVTEKIYILLKEVLEIEKGMEEIVSISLFESIKTELNRSLLPRTHEILEKMFTLIHPLTFIRIIMVYSHKLFIDEFKIEKQRFIVEKMVSISTNTLIKNIGKHFDDVSEQILQGYNEHENRWIELWGRDPISFLKLCIFTFKFVLAEKILYFEIKMRSDICKQKDLKEIEQKNVEMMTLPKMDLKKEKKMKKMKRKKQRLYYYKKKNDETLSTFLMKLEEVYSLLISQSFSKRVSFVLDMKLKEKLMRFAGLTILVRKSDHNAVLELKRLNTLQTSPFRSKLTEEEELKRIDIEEKLFQQYLKVRKHYINFNCSKMKGESDPLIDTPVVRRRKTSGSDFRKKRVSAVTNAN